MGDPCDVCGAAGAMTPLVEAGLPGVGMVRIHRCGGCGLRQVRPRPAPEALETLYGADYFGSESAHGFAGYARQKQRYDREAYFLARALRRLAPGGRFLEVGSALGFLLRALALRTGWVVEGLEVSAFGAWYARDRFGATVHRGTLEEAALPRAAFDYVMQKDVLEHVTHPRRHLEETRRIMRPGARLRVITPNGEADLRPLLRAAAGAGDDEVPVLDQGHLSFFSGPQLLGLFDSAGFRVLRMRSIGLRRGLSALGAIPGRRSRIRLARRADLAVRTASGGDAADGADAIDGADGGDGRAPLVAERREEQAARIDAGIAACQRRIRGWTPYYHYRRFVKRLDAVPGWLAVGQDFDLLVEKR